MKVALISDVHANIYALKAVLADIRGRNVQETICLGDVVGYCAAPNEVIELLREKNIPLVKGNYDDSIGNDLPSCGCLYTDPEQIRLAGLSVEWTAKKTTAANKEYLRNLPLQLTRTINGKKVLFVHGSPRQINEYLRQDTSEADMLAAIADVQCDILAGAHTHLPFHRLIKGVHFVNSGSVGKPKHGNPNSNYVLLDVTDTVTVDIIEVAYDYEQAAKDIENSALPNEFAEIIRRGR